jgi:hypothetical protein
MEGSYQEISKDRKSHKYTVWCYYTIPCVQYVLACFRHFANRNSCVYMCVSVFFIVDILCVCTSHKIVILFHIQGFMHAYMCVCVCPNNFGSIWRIFINTLSLASI